MDPRGRRERDRCRRSRVLEGEWHGNRTAIIDFPTVETAQRWYDCAEYQAVIGMRQEAAESNGTIVAGFEFATGALG